MEKKRAAIYCRVDTGKDNESGTIAVSVQEQRARKYAARKGIEIAAVYTDIGYSGQSMERPGLKALLADHAEGKFDLVLAVSRTRLYRGLSLNAPKWPFKLVCLNELSQRKER